MEEIVGGLVCMGLLAVLVFLFVGLAISGIKANEERAAKQRAVQATYITQAKFQAVIAGMSFDDVVSILGPPESEISTLKIADTVAQTYRWKAGLLAHALITFENGKLSSKGAIGF